MKKETEKTRKEVEISEVREHLIKRITDKYGTIGAFLNSEDAVRFGGKKLQPYLSATGPISYDKFRALCKFFKVGVLTRETKVVRTTKYFLG